MADAGRREHARVRRIASLSFLCAVSLAACCSVAFATEIERATSSPPTAGRRAQLLGDLRELGSCRTLAFVGVAGVVAGIGGTLLDDEDVSGPLDRSFLDPVADAGRTYGSTWFLGSATLAVWGVGALADDPGIRDLGWDLGESLAITGLVVGAIKVSVDRKRPDGGDWSFPSGHSAESFTIVPVLAEHVGWKTGAVGAVAATFVALGRLEDLRHYPSDVLFGAGLGLAVGYAVSRPPATSSLSWNVGPGSLGLSARF
ncbi:MAG: phosphatase PAP2 family protein [Gemmatimonadetes bacterium]|nr:phosphatase PAP2 family protein [Gemmatimonadota bacterium]